jgi:predicted Rossmann fold nucleotide-binding protein DprA/Smf involved in DNA uptake
VITDAAYWIALTHIPGWNHQKINSLITKIYIDYRTSLEGFFGLEVADWDRYYELNDADIVSLSRAKIEIPSDSFLAESLSNQGYELIPITSPEYSPTLKRNLKLTYSPSLLYVKGNKQLLLEKSVAIVGSRTATEISLVFTDNIAKKATQENNVVVSGFAKGIDKAALEAALSYQGQSIIVLPQGIQTFGPGFKTYYKQIINGDVLVLSTFYPQAPWKVELAMARNPIIYGLAEEIYVAESAAQGGTWSGVKDGLRKGRVIYVRRPEPNEANANNQLIALGGVAVDVKGNSEEQAIHVGTSDTTTEQSGIDDKIMDFINGKARKAKEICDKIGMGWEVRKMTNYLKTLPNVEVLKIGNLNRYRVKGSIDEQKTIF